MKNIFLTTLLLTSFLGFSQTTEDSSKTFTKRVLENTEVDLITSFYGQDGDNAAVTGGIGTEKLTDIATTITVSIPLNANDVLTIDGTISAYSSASSSNLNPFDASGASRNGDDDDDDKKSKSSAAEPVTGSPWVESSGASKSDVWANGDIGYSHSSNDRNTIVGANLSFANEFDYTSVGIGGNFTKLFNEKNTEISIKGNVYFDSWQPVYPTEIKSYNEVNKNLNKGFFEGIDILNQSGAVINKTGTTIWSPFNTTLVENKSRNTYSASLSFSQIVTKKAQISIFLDVVQQSGWLSNPMQRVYFSDRPNYYIGNASNITNYTSKKNTDVFQLADDIEREICNTMKHEIPSKIIGEIVMKHLKTFDKVAYIRFASVYRKFSDIDNFKQELENLNSMNKDKLK